MKTLNVLGVSGDWENPYVTLTPDYEAAQIRVFGEMANKGYIYRGANQFTGHGHLSLLLQKLKLNTMIWFQLHFTMPTKVKRWQGCPRYRYLHRCLDNNSIYHHSFSWVDCWCGY